MFENLEIATLELKMGFGWAGLLLLLHLWLQIICTVSSDCSLNLSSYPYQPTGECLHGAERIKRWAGVRTDRCCGSALDTLSQALALEANTTLSLFLPEDRWLACQPQSPDLASLSSSPDRCVFKNLYKGSDGACSNLNISAFREQHGDQYQYLLDSCYQFTTSSFNDACSSCTRAIKGMVEYLKKHVGVKVKGKAMEAACAVAVVVSIAAAGGIRNATWVEEFYRCLPALDRMDANYLRIKKSLAKVILAVLIAVVGLALIIGLIQRVTGGRKKKKKTCTKESAKPTKEEGKGINTTWSGLYRFSRFEIERAMSYRNDRECLGAGSAGRVYKGILPSGQLVAIKHIYKSNHSDSFTREVEGLSRIRHPNLVCLFGCCVDGGDHFLVYEYCPFGNLAQHLLRNDNVLQWDTRVKIMRDCALALRFLHNYPDGCIVHRDIKLTNILMMENMEPKLSDFGLAKMLGMQESKVFTDVRGTIGYMDPEYMINAKLTCGSDVYSFGIVLLQILSGRRVIELDLDARDHLTRKAKDVVMGKRPLSDFVDPRLNGQLNMEDFAAILHVAVLCVAKSSKGRPTIVVVFEELDKVWKNSFDKLHARTRNEPDAETTQYN